ncbi:MAG: tetratricopeptide repeat protein [Myxococcota bacterium]|nr:tetratricopeptide repeat protein [Myxococcota bacterium]
MRLDRLRCLSLAILLLGGTPASAQIDRAPQPIDLEPNSGSYEEEAEQPEEEAIREEVPSRPVRAAPPVPESRPTTARTPEIAPVKAAQKTPEQPAPVVAARVPPKPILLPAASDATLLATWDRWRKAWADLDLKTAEAAQEELITLKEDLGIEDLETFSFAFARASEVKLLANDPMASLSLAQAAVKLAPDLPSSHLALAKAQFAVDAAAFGEYAGSVQNGLAAMLRDPRYQRPVLADLASAVIFALLATALAVTGVLFLRKVRYFLHDFHHLFPRSAARWQSLAIAVLLLSLPIVFRLGLTPILLVGFASVVLYLSVPERIVAAALIALLGGLPLLAGVAVEQTAFAGTVAEDLQRLERGGDAAEEAAARLTRRHLKEQPRFPELFALARYELRRGKLDAAVTHFKAAAALRTNDARLLTNLGNAMMAQGDPEGAAEMYKSATQADPTLAAPLYNISRLYNRRAATAPDEQVGGELDKALTAITTAQKLDEALLTRKEPPEENLLHNRLLISPPLPPSDLTSLAVSPERGDRVRAQLALALVGTAEDPVASVYPALGALLLLGLGLTAARLGSSRACEKCGRAVCRRCDPELGMGSQLCNQCVNVFARKGVVPPAVKVRKQLEVDRYQGRMNRLSYLFGLVCSGAGHLFSGLPVRGALYVFGFLFLVFNFFFRMGIVRPPFGSLPMLMRLAPVGLAFLLLYLLSLRGLYKRQTE